MQYRTLERLSGDDGTVYEMDIVSPLKGISPKVIAVLLEKKRISIVQAPPLTVIPGFEGRAAEYEKQGIETVNDMSGEEDDFEEVLAWSTVEQDVYELEPEDSTSPLLSGEGLDDELVV